MISIIVSSYKPVQFDNFSQNVEETIGPVPYEIIQISNPGLMGICEAYNKGGKEAKYPYLVFAHEDILFHSSNWGSTLTDIFQNDAAIGLVGVAGGFYKTLHYSGWSLQSNVSSMLLIGSHYGKSVLTQIKNGRHKNFPLDDPGVIPDLMECGMVNEEVMLLDGMFMATKKNIFEHIPFDEKNFKGFHCYDLDYSLQMRGKFKVVVTHNILIEHFSAGDFGADWVENVKILEKKWRQSLPASCKPYSFNEKNHFEFVAYERLLRVYKSNGIHLAKSLYQLWTFAYVKQIGFLNWLVINFKIARKATQLLTRRIKPA